MIGPCSFFSSQFIHNYAIIQVIERVLQMEKYNYILGLDLGTGSVGWGCMLVDENQKPMRILDLGSRIFEPQGASMEERRLARGTRRVLRRRKARVNRTRNLFVKHNYLTKEAVWNLDRKASCQPYSLRLKGKEEALTMEELAIILVHYAKGRGFKSNRKVLEENVKETASADDEQKMLSAKRKSEQYLAEKQKANPNYTLTNMLLEISQNSGKIRNTSGNYQNGITRKMIAEEVEMILDCQIQYDLISEEFKKEYLEILLHQRMFTDGPDEPSPYHKPLDKMIGNCGFTGEKRAAKASCSYELFTLAQKLTDLRYVDKESKENLKLSAAQIEELVTKAEQGKSITYKLVSETIGKNIYFPGLMISKEDYLKLVDKIKENPNLVLADEVNKAKENIVIFKMKNTASIKKMLKKQLGYPVNLEINQYDLIADCLTRNKSDQEIINYLTKERPVLNEVTLPDEVIEAVKQMDDAGFKEFGKVSYTFLNQILPFMIHEGMDYYNAAKANGYDTAKKHENDQDFDTIPIINEILNDLDKTITNKAVIRTLVETRKVVNAIFKRYGKPQRIHVEMARELTKSADERKKLENQMVSNQISNNALKAQIYTKHPDKFASPAKISGNDLLQYKLYLEQQGLCPYTLLQTGDEQQAKIHESTLFTDDVEIDHIIPYSLCFDDRPVNKALVKKKANQDKGNRTPLEAFKQASGLKKYQSFVRDYRINLDKKDRYLADKLDDRFLNDYRARTINDTRYAAKALKEILHYSFPSIKINSFTGQITAKLRGIWRLNGLTHSWQSVDYQKKIKESKEIEDLQKQLGEKLIHGISQKSKEYREIEKKIINLQKKDSVKNRENHIHHAVDAIVLACATDKIRRNIEMHEMMLRQKKNAIIHFRIPEIDEDTGEVLNIEEFDMTVDEYSEKYKDQALFEKTIFPQPYFQFRKELILRAYEMDREILQEQLDLLPHYQNVDVKKITPIFISHHFSSKLSGKLHKATYYGLKESENGSILTERISVTSASFDDKKLEELFDKEGTQDYIYQTLKEWLKGCVHGEEAYLKKGMPTNKNGNPIKKVKLNAGLVKEKFSLKKEASQYVAKEDVVQVHIYRRENDDKLYFVGMDRFRILNSDNREDIPFVLWTGQGNANITVKKSELQENGFIKKPLKLLKGQTILVKLKNGNRGLCLLVGFGAGMLEVESIVGDGNDLIKNNLIKGNMERYRLTVSTIKSIKPISVDVLGKIH